MPEQFGNVPQRDPFLTETARVGVPEIVPAKIRNLGLADGVDKPMGIDVERLASGIPYHATFPVPAGAEDHQSAHGILVQWDIYGIIVFRRRNRGDPLFEVHILPHEVDVHVCAPQTGVNREVNFWQMLRPLRLEAQSLAQPFLFSGGEEAHAFIVLFLAPNADYRTLFDFEWVVLEGEAINEGKNILVVVPSGKAPLFFLGG